MMEEEDKIVQKTSRIRLIKDKMAGSMMLTFTLVSVLLVVLIGIGLVLKSLPILHDKSLWSYLVERNGNRCAGISVSCRLLWVPFG